MIDSKAESDVSSNGTSSPKQQMYFVQSPSLDYHDDGDKSSSVLSRSTNTPTYRSPTASPSHPSYALNSCSSRISSGVAAFRWANASYSGRKGRTLDGRRHCPEDRMIGEDGGYAFLSGDNKGISPEKCRASIAVLTFVCLFTVFCSILWFASKHFTPRIYVRSLNIHEFYYAEGSDRTGVPTKMVTVKMSANMLIQNPATFFGIHVHSSAVRLMFSELTIATGQLRPYYQPRNSQHTTSVKISGNKVPLYGAGPSLAAAGNRGVLMKLVFEIQSQGHVVGALVKSEHRWHLSCSLIICSNSTKPIKFDAKSCQSPK